MAAIISTAHGKNSQITTYYPLVEIGELIEAVEKVSWSGQSTPTLMRSENFRKFPAIGLKESREAV